MSGASNGGVDRQVPVTPSEPDAFQLAAAAMVELAAAWAKLHNALVRMGQDKALRP